MNNSSITLRRNHSLVVDLNNCCVIARICGFTHLHTIPKTRQFVFRGFETGQ